VLNANNENANTRPYPVFYLADVVTRVGADRVERAAKMLESLATMGSKITAARASGWKKYPSLYIGDVADDPAKVEVVFAALTDLLAQA
jgi:hypothetical protein